MRTAPENLFQSSRHPSLPSMLASCRCLTYDGPQLFFDRNTHPGDLRRANKPDIQEAVARYAIYQRYLRFHSHPIAFHFSI